MSAHLHGHRMMTIAVTVKSDWIKSTGAAFRVDFWCSVGNQQLPLNYQPAQAVHQLVALDESAELTMPGTGDNQSFAIRGFRTGASPRCFEYAGV